MDSLLYLYNVLHNMGYQKNEERLYIFFMVPIINISTTYICLDNVQIQQSHCLLVPVVFIEQFPILNVLSHFQYVTSQVTSLLLSIRLYWHHTTTILFYSHLLFSSCGNSASWSWHQIVMLPSSTLL